MDSKYFKYPFIDGCQGLPKNKDEDLKKIKVWLGTQLHLPKFNDEFLHLFLHSNYYDLEETKNNIQAYFSLRIRSPELFANKSLSDPKLKATLDNHFFAMSPKRTPEGYQVVMFGLKENPTFYDHTYAVKAMFILFDIMISECGLCPGYIFVSDTKNVTLSVSLKQNYSNLAKILNYFQEAAPVRVRHIIVINSMLFIDKVFSIFRPFIKSTCANKLQFHPTGSDLTKFYESVPRECFFEEYGGTAGSLKTASDNYTKLLKTKYSKWIEEDSIYAVEGQNKEPAKRSFFSFW